MRVFVTGASGWVGTVVVQALITAGHQVTGLARSDESAKKLEELGAQVERGSLEDHESLKRGAAAADGVIHLAFIHDFTDYANSAKKDLAAIQAIGSVLVGTNKPFISTTGFGSLMKYDRVVTEDDPPNLNLPALWLVRHPSDEATLALAKQGVRAILIRLPPSVHGKGDKAFVPVMVNSARKAASAAYPGTGSNYWPSVHRLDAAQLYRLALEKGRAGATYFATHDEGVSLLQINEVIGKNLKVPVVSKSGKELEEHLGWLAPFASEIDLRASSRKTQEELGWKPTQLGLLADMEQNYF